MAVYQKRKFALLSLMIALSATAYPAVSEAIDVAGVDEVGVVADGTTQSITDGLNITGDGAVGAEAKNGGVINIIGDVVSSGLHFDADTATGLQVGDGGTINVMGDLTLNGGGYTYVGGGVYKSTDDGNIGAVVEENGTLKITGDLNLNENGSYPDSLVGATGVVMKGGTVTIDGTVDIGLALKNILGVDMEGGKLTVGGIHNIGGAYDMDATTAIQMKDGEIDVINDIVVGNGGNVGINMEAGSIRVHGDVISQGTTGTGIRMESGTVVVDGDVIAGNGALATYGIEMIDGSTTIKGHLSADHSGRGVYMHDGYVEVRDGISVNDGAAGIEMQDGTAKVIGDISVNGEFSKGLKVNGGEATVTGNISVAEGGAGFEENSLTHGVSVSDGKVTVKGDISVGGTGFSQGIYAEGGEVILQGDLTSSSRSYGMLLDGGTVTMTGDLYTNALTGGGWGYGIENNGADLTLTGDVTVEGANLGGIVTGGGTTSVTGDIRVSDGNIFTGDRTWAVMHQGGQLDVDGDIYVDDAGGVFIANNGKTATFDSQVEVKNDGVGFVVKSGTADITGDMTIDNVAGSSYGYGIILEGDAAGTAAKAIVTGDIEAKNKSIAIQVSGGSDRQVVVNGDMNIDNNSFGAYVVGGKVEVNGDITATNKSRGIDLRADSSAVVTGDILANDSWGAYLGGSNANLTMDGNVVASNTATGIYSYEGNATIDGNVSADNATGIISEYGYVNITGDVSAVNGGRGANVGEYGSSTIGGEVTADGIGSKGVDLYGDNARAIINNNVYAKNGGTGINSDWGTVTVTGDISADNNSIGFYGAYTLATITGNVSATNKSTGIKLWNEAALVTLDGDLSADDSDGAFVDGTNTTLHITGDVTSTANGARGVFVNNGTAVVDGSVSSNNGAIGVSAANGGVVYANELVVSGTNSMGAYAAGGAGIIYVAGDVSVSGTDAIGLYADGNSGAGQIHMNGGNLDIASGSYGMKVDQDGAIELSNITALNDQVDLLTTESSGVVKISGNSEVHGKITHQGTSAGTMQVELMDSLFDGMISQPNVSSTSRIDLTMTDSNWHMTEDSTLGTLNLNGSTVNFGEFPGSGGTRSRVNPSYMTLNVAELNGGGTFGMYTDLGNLVGDKIVIADNSDGQYILDIENNGAAAVNGSERLVVVEDTQIGTADATFELDHLVEYGGYAYNLRQVPGSPTDWELYHLASPYRPGPNNPGPSTPADAGVNLFFGSYLLNYAETQTLMKRLGDLREGNGKEKGDIWARVMGGKFTTKGDGFLRGFDMDYWGIQAGWDRKIERNDGKGKVYVGGMFGYSKGNLDYQRGSGSLDSKTLGAYWTHIHRNDSYADIVFKYGWMKNEFNVRDSAGTQVKAKDIDTQGFSFSMEFGRRYHFDQEVKKGFYIEPQTQLTIGHQSGDRFTASNGLKVKAESYRSVLWRVGTHLGYEVKGGKNPVNVYAKWNWVKEFDGEMGYTLNGSPEMTSYKGTWHVWGVGATAQFGKKHNLYFDLERATGGNFTHDWAINGGYRFNW